MMNLPNKPKKPIDKNKVYLYIITFLILFWTVSSVFGFIGYGRSKKHHASALINASADIPTARADYINEFSVDLLAPFSIEWRTVNELPIYYFNQDIAIHQDFGVSNTPDTDTTPLFESYAESFVGIEGYTNYLNMGPALVYVRGYNQPEELAWSQRYGWEADGYRTIEFLKLHYSASSVWNDFLYDYSILINAQDTLGKASSLFGDEISMDGAYIYWNDYEVTNSRGIVEPNVWDVYFTSLSGDEFRIPCILTAPNDVDQIDNTKYNILWRVQKTYSYNAYALVVNYRLIFDSYSTLGGEAVLDELNFTLVFDFSTRPIYNAGGEPYLYFPIGNRSYSFYNNTLQLQYDIYQQEIKYQDCLRSYNDGYLVGLQNGTGGGSNDFEGLIGAVVDVPIKTFFGLFDMEILGVNLAGFFISILSVCAVIAIIRLIL